MKGHTYQTKDLFLVIVNEELIVNFRHYGTLSTGDEITVEKAKVFVNGREVKESRGKVKITRSF
jgi:hypothetical protein